jgi:hypothetical protein
LRVVAADGFPAAVAGARAHDGEACALVVGRRVEVDAGVAGSAGVDVGERQAAVAKPAFQLAEMAGVQQLRAADDDASVRPRRHEEQGDCQQLIHDVSPIVAPPPALRRARRRAAF